MGLKFKWNTGVRPFRSAVISSAVAVVAIAVLVQSVWSYSDGHTFAIVGGVVLLLLIGLQLLRVRSMYTALYPRAAEGDPLLTKALNATMRTHLWSSGVLMLLALAFYQFSLNHR
jgi:hypothetical protein